MYKNAFEQLDFYSQFIKKGDLVFDIGANVGDKTDLFLKLGAKVIAVEPQESCWRLLKHRFKDKNVTVITSALSFKEGKVTMFTDKSPTISSISQDWISTVKKNGRFSNSHKWAGKVTADTTTLDELIAQYGKPAFCKIDVEGAELEVLKGLTQPISAISFEFISEQAEVAINCTEYLSKLSQSQFNYYMGETMSFEMQNWVDSDEIKTIILKMTKELKNSGDIYVRSTTT